MSFLFSMRFRRFLEALPAIPKQDCFDNSWVSTCEDSAAVALPTSDFQFPEGFQGRSPWLQSSGVLQAEARLAPGCLPMQKVLNRSYWELLPSCRAVGEEGCGFLTKGFPLCGRAVARLAAFAERFARTPALACSVEAAPWFSRTHVPAKVTASPLAGKAPYG